MILHTENHKLVDDSGRLFFYTADTAWELFHKLSLDEAKLFIDNRAAKGFNVLQAVAVAELDGLKTPARACGCVPFKDLKTLEPDDKYFVHVKEVIAYANSRGIFIALVPMWGSYFVQNAAWGGKVKPIFDAESARRFVTYLAGVVKGLQVIWLLGGDRPYLTPESRAVMNAMAAAIREQAGSTCLITAHSQGGRSVWDMLEQPEWLDFISWQSGHMGECYPSWRNIESDYARTGRPVLDAEPCYESHPIMREYDFSRMDSGSRFTDFYVRRSSYWSVFSGACGITYGCYGIWQMRREEDENAEIPESAASAYAGERIPYWHESLDFPGSRQIGYLRKFMESLPDPLSVRPDNSLILSDNSTGEGHMAALTNEAKSFIAVYVPHSATLCVDISVFEGSTFDIYWYDPRYNIRNFLSSSVSETKYLNISTPRCGGDFVLLLLKHQG